MIKPYQSYFKRIIDIFIASIVIFFGGPIFVILFIASTLSTREVGIFIQKRVGLNGQEFNLYKFKTMIGINHFDKGIGSLSKSRVTQIGSVLRKTHLDELPQFFMVLIGKMSLVGPRPEVPEIVNHMNNSDYASFISVRPGLISPASLKYINEENILEGVTDPEEIYIKQILPDKIKMNQNYITNISLINDLNIFVEYLMLILKIKPKKSYK